MGIFSRKKEQKNTQTIDDIIERSSSYGNFGALYFGGGSSYTESKAMNLSAVYRAVEIISDSIAQLPLDLYRVDSDGYKTKDIHNPLYAIINKEPNERQSRYTFVKLLITSMLLRGNAYAYVMRNEQGRPIQLIYIPSEFVTIKPPLYLNQPVTYTVAGINGEVLAKDMIHLLNFSYDGVVGISTLRHAAISLGLASDAENHAKGFFSGGCAIGGTLTVNSSLTSKQKQELKQSWQQAFSPETGRPNSVAILEGNMSYNPIGIDPTSSQLLETRQFSVIEIARWFGVSPVKLFDLSKSSYSTVEATNLSFLTDTLAPILQKIELEFERKLFSDNEKNTLDIKFDVSQLLRADKQGQANYYQTLFNIGAISINEIRKELDFSPIPDGDVNFVQANLLSVKNAANNVPANSALTIKNNDTIDKEK